MNFGIEIIIVGRTEDFAPIVKRLDTMETFIVDDSAIYEKVHLASLSRALYVDSYNLIHTTSSIGVNGNITDS